MLDILAQAGTQAANNAPFIGDLGLGAAGVAIGAGIVVVGGAKGIGHLAGSALEGMARQPEAAGRIQTAMIIAAALIEGFTFFALVIALLVSFKLAA